MRSAGIYAIQAEIGNCKFLKMSKGDILITLRVGRNSVSINYSNQADTTEVNFNTAIQLNVDNSALQTQRCSITINSSNGTDKKVLGIALISLPKDKSYIQNVYRLTQSEDKRAQIDVKIKITPLDGNSSGMNKNFPLPLSSQASINKDTTVQRIKQSESKTGYSQKNGQSNSSSNIKLKSKISEQFSHAESDQKKVPKGFKIRQQDKVVQISESEIRRYKDQKDAYYQLYQIQKSKNQVASRFISAIIRKISEKFPSLLSNLSEITQIKKISSDAPLQKKQNKIQQQAQQAEMNSQLQQANRSLHRQVEEYKKIIDQLRLQVKKSVSGPNQELKPHNNWFPPGMLDLSSVPRPTSIRQRYPIQIKSNILPPNLFQQEKKASPSSNLTDIDFKKWLQISIGQRESIQELLINFTSKIQPEKFEKQQQKNQTLIKKVKNKVDKLFAALFAKDGLTRQGLLSQKQQVNKFFDQINNK